MNPLPGDLVFYPQDRELSSQLIAWAQRAFKVDGLDHGLQMVHVAMMGNNSLILEMAWPRAQSRSFAADSRTKVIKRPVCDDAVKQKAIQWAMGHIKERYNILDYAFSDFGFVDSTRFCSAWIENGAYTIGGGFPLIAKSEHGYMCSPDELFMSELLVPVRE